MNPQLNSCSINRQSAACHRQPHLLHLCYLCFNKVTLIKTYSYILRGPLYASGPS